MTHALASDTENAHSHERIEVLTAENARLREQIEWFKRQVFGPRSEKRPAPEADQPGLFTAQPPEAEVSEPAIEVPAHVRRKHRTGEEVNAEGLRFGPEVPVRTIRLSCPELDGPEADQYEVIGLKESLRLARQPGSHVVLRYERPVVRRKVDGQLAPPVPI